MIFSNKQQLVFDKYLNDENIFITGPGGTGKTAIIRELANHARKNNKIIQICALTGCATVLLNCKAKTIHSWSGIGLANNDIDYIVNDIYENKYKRRNWRNIDILIIDEVSMLSLKLFNLLDQVAKACRGNRLPFGGIQIIFSGDFFQLPPIGTEKEPDTLKFCFESKLWNEYFPNQIILEENFRQTGEEYNNILNEIRIGKITNKSYNTLKKYVGRNINLENELKPTILYPTRNKVDQINKNSLEKLKGDYIKFKIEVCNINELTISEKDRRSLEKYSNKQISYELNNLISNVNCEKKLKLKIGAQVMCIANIDMESKYPIYNGSQGIIKEFTDYGPIVKFNNGTTRIIGKHIWQSENIKSVGIKQIPLILAWAITIHKSQGASLDIAQIDVGSKIFECGQTYVALSRIKSLNGLFLKSFNPDKIKVNEKVKEFYDNLIN
jgi:ATP-dependent DNA helicase PIF1